MFNLKFVSINPSLKNLGTKHHTVDETYIPIAKEKNTSGKLHSQAHSAKTPPTSIFFVLRNAQTVCGDISVENSRVGAIHTWRIQTQLSLSQPREKNGEKSTYGIMQNSPRWKRILGYGMSHAKRKRVHRVDKRPRARTHEFARARTSSHDHRANYSVHEKLQMKIMKQQSAQPIRTRTCFFFLENEKKF